MSDMQITVGNQITMINSAMCLRCAVGNQIRQGGTVEDVKTLSQYLYSARQQFITYLVYNIYMPYEIIGCIIL